MFKFKQALLHGVAAAALIVALAGADNPGNYQAAPGADSAYAESQGGDPPTRVGRLSYAEGTVSFHSSDQDQWSPATLNFPVTTGDAFWTEPGARAEMQVAASAVRLDQKTEVDVVRLDDSGSQLNVAQGTIEVSFSNQPESGFAVLTPRGKVTFTQPGRYRIDAGEMNGDQPSDQVSVTVLQGEARFDASNGSRGVSVGQTLTVDGDPANFTVGQALQVTPFDEWAQSRDPKPMASAEVPAGQSIRWNAPAPAASPSLQYVSPNMTGYQDLDTYGTWTNTADYGAVWYPTSVAPGWAPYRFGHWAYVLPWGWTWIDDAPWGFAPFHYGRWAFIDGSWGWSPGAYARHPVYAPALVAFVGDPGFSVGISIGFGERDIGWVPLAPHEPFRPFFRASPTYIRNVNVTTVNTTVINNITNVTNVTNVNEGATLASFRNARGATMVRGAAFAGAAPVEKARVSIKENEFAKARVTNRLDFKPSAAARAGVVMPAAVKASAGPGGTFGNTAALAVPKAPGPALNRENWRARGEGRIGGARVGATDAKTGSAHPDTGPAAAAPTGGAPGPAITRRDDKNGNGNRGPFNRGGESMGRSSTETAPAAGTGRGDAGSQRSNGNANHEANAPDHANTAAQPTIGAPGPAIPRRDDNNRGGNRSPFNPGIENAARANGGGAPGPAIARPKTGTATSAPAGNDKAGPAPQTNVQGTPAAPGPTITRRNGGALNMGEAERGNAERVRGPNSASRSPGSAILQRSAVPAPNGPRVQSQPGQRVAPAGTWPSTPSAPNIGRENARERTVTRPAILPPQSPASLAETRRATPLGPAIGARTPVRAAPAAPIREPAMTRRETPSAPAVRMVEPRQAPAVGRPVLRETAPMQPPSPQVREMQVPRRPAYMESNGAARARVEQARRAPPANDQRRGSPGRQQGRPDLN